MKLHALWKTGIAIFSLLGTTGIAPALAAESGLVASRTDEPIKIITVPNDLDSARVELGKKLFFDPRLSKSGFISCNSCHNLSTGGTDNLTTSVGHGWHEGPINSPTVLNSSYNIAQFWDGRASDLQEQAAGPIANPGEMAFEHSLAISVVESIPGYVEEFQQVFGSSQIDMDLITSAIAEFERFLVTPNSRFDRWLQGDDDAMTMEEKKGYELFKSVGCASCHNGPAAGGGSFMKMGLVAPFETDNKAQGRIAVTGSPDDVSVFKVPTLRNVELTYPYFHDGSAYSLREAVDIMAVVQLGQDLNAEEIDRITAFLVTLTGELPAMELPRLPPSTESTPRPQPFQ